MNGARDGGDIGTTAPDHRMRLLTIAGSGLAFLLLAAAMRHGGLAETDEQILRWIRERASRGGDPARVWGEETVVAITSLGSVFVLAALACSVSAPLWWTGRKKAAAFLLIALLGALGLNYGLKAIFGRARPAVVAHIQRVDSPSFPSGHALISTAVYTALGMVAARLAGDWRLRAQLVSMAAALPFLVGLSRMYLGVHYLTDVLAGWAAGLIWALVSWPLARALERRGCFGRDG